MKKIYKILAVMCTILGLCILAPESAQAEKLTMKNTGSKITLEYDDRHTFKNKIEKIICS